MSSTSVKKTSPSTRKKCQTKTVEQRVATTQDLQTDVPIEVIEPEVFPSSSPSDAALDRQYQGEAKVGVACEPLTRLSIPMGDQLLAERKKERQRKSRVVSVQMDPVNSLEGTTTKAEKSEEETPAHSLAQWVNGEVDSATIEALAMQKATTQWQKSEAKTSDINLKSTDNAESHQEEVRKSVTTTMSQQAVVCESVNDCCEEKSETSSNFGEKQSIVVSACLGLALIGCLWAIGLWLGWFASSAVTVGVVDRAALREVLLSEAKTARLSEMEVWLASFEQDVYRHAQAVAADTGAVLVDARSVLASPVRHDFTPQVAAALQQQWQAQRQAWEASATSMPKRDDKPESISSASS